MPSAVSLFAKSVLTKKQRHGLDEITRSRNWKSKDRTATVFYSDSPMWTLIFCLIVATLALISYVVEKACQFAASEDEGLDSPEQE